MNEATHQRKFSLGLMSIMKNTQGTSSHLNLLHIQSKLKLLLLFTKHKATVLFTLNLSPGESLLHAWAFMIASRYM